MTLSEPCLTYDVAALTDRGCVRPQNEDSVLALTGSGLWAVADGMGGHQAGDVASAIVVEELASLGVPVSAADQGARVIARLDRANRRIIEQTGGAAGATVAALLIHEDALTCIWAGDSRVYLFREGRLTRLTRDHSEVALLVAAGRMTEAEARHAPRRNVITRAIGTGPSCAPETVSGIARDRDRFLICSDGLTEHLDDAALAGWLAMTERAATLARGLIDETLRLGARDNVSVIIVDCFASCALSEADQEA